MTDRKPFPDPVAVQAACRLLDVERESLERFLEVDRLTGGSVGARFTLSYSEVSRLTGVSEATLRQRVHSGTYVEGVDYQRRGPRTVRFSARVVGRERDQ